MSAPSYYRRNLPHIVPPGATLFITFRLAGTLPAHVTTQLQTERASAEAALTAPAPATLRALHKRLFVAYDQYLDQNDQRINWLTEPAIATLVGQEIRRLSELNVAVICYCIMPNHVHALVQLPDDPLFSFPKMMQLLKGRTAFAANRLLGRANVPFWQHESYDHFVYERQGVVRVVDYILANPVKAGLVREWQEWPYSFLGEF